MQKKEYENAIGGEEMFEELWEPIENVQDYLDRISCGPAEEIRHDKETLDRLVRNHQIFVPFENLDIYDLDKNVSLRMQDLYDKVVVKLSLIHILQDRKNPPSAAAQRLISRIS